MTTPAPPFQELYDLGDLGRGSAEFRITANADELSRIARWADIRAVKSFSATVELRRHSASMYSLDAHLIADIVQDCVVTLEPVDSHIDRHIHRQLHLTAPVRHREDISIALTESAGDDDVPEEIDSLEYDVAGPLLEEFVLAIDPYPRAPGVEFAAPPEAETPAESPFAALKSLKNRP